MHFYFISCRKQPTLDTLHEEKYVNKSINQSAGRAFGRKAGKASTPKLTSVAYVLTSKPRQNIGNQYEFNRIISSYESGVSGE